MGLAVASNWARTRLFGAAALAHVAVDAALQADLVGRVDVDAEVVEREKLVVVQREDAFDDDDARWHDRLEGVGHAGVAAEVVDGALNGVAEARSRTCSMKSSLSSESG